MPLFFAPTPQARGNTSMAAEPIVRQIDLTYPLRWLQRGYEDIVAAPGASLMHGVLVAVGGIVVMTIAMRFWPLLPGALSGFMLIGPILATGLYELSRRRQQGVQPQWSDVVRAWQRGTRPLVGLGLLLFAAATAWVLFSALMFKLFVHTPIANPMDLLRYIVLEQDEWMFWLWLLAGGLGAALVFAGTAVSAPLLLDRRVGLKTAVLTSVRAVGDNPAAMGLWAVIVMAATAASMMAAMLGLVFAVPLIGHATWHAYRDLLDVNDLPERHPAVR